MVASLPHLSERSRVIAAAVAASAGLTLGAWGLYSLYHRSREERILAEYRAAMALPTSKLREIRDDVVRQARQGLSRTEGSTMLMLPSMVDILPNGSEQGKYYAIDIGGTNFRVVYADLSVKHGELADMRMQECNIPENLFSVHVTELFDFMAKSLVDFAKELSTDTLSGARPKVGFCFSFPIDQTSLGSGRIVRMTKAFSNPGAAGADAVRLLSDAFARLGAAFDVVALVNDTVGTLAAARYASPDAYVGVIMGTGSNACYLEQTKNIPKLPKGGKYGEEMIINCEWGGYTSEVLPTLEEDRELDRVSPNVGQQHFEKLVAGMYMGEVARRILVRLHKEAGLFSRGAPPRLNEAWAFTTPQLAAIDGDTSADLFGVAQTLAEGLGLAPSLAPLRTRQVVKEVADLVVTRSARLAVAAIAALLRQAGRDGANGAALPAHTVVAIDGGVFSKFAGYRARLQAALADVLGPDVAARVELKHQGDGSSLGAAYLAAAVARGAPGDHPRHTREP